jgi:hypothetical protein
MATPIKAERRQDEPSQPGPAGSRVRGADLEPHAGLRYIARLFKVLAILLVLLLVAEVVMGLVQQGAAALPELLTEATRLVVFAALLWAAGDIALMMIESNHDLRATRILLGRISAQTRRISGSGDFEPELPPSRERLEERTPAEDTLP